MEIKIFGLYFGKNNWYGFNFINIDNRNYSRGLFKIIYRPKVEIRIDILFIRMYIDL